MHNLQVSPVLYLQFCPMKYTATTDTFLKKFPKQASALADIAKISVPKGKTYLVKTVLGSDEYELHNQVELDHDAGSWWVYKPHWNTNSDAGVVEAVFSLNQARSEQLIYGKLTFTRGGKELLSVKATSGQSSYQYAGAHTMRGKGCLPPRADWKISTKGYYSATRGIEGMFYHITPDPDPGTGRSEFGLHRDANVPGSAGCIVVADTTEFNQKVQPLMAELSHQQDFVSLTVNYT
jgi:hypothetical protein